VSTAKRADLVSVRSRGRITSRVVSTQPMIASTAHQRFQMNVGLPCTTTHSVAKPTARSAASDFVALTDSAARQAIAKRAIATSKGRRTRLAPPTLRTIASSVSPSTIRQAGLQKRTMHGAVRTASSLAAMACAVRIENVVCPEARADPVFAPLKAWITSPTGSIRRLSARCANRAKPMLPGHHSRMTHSAAKPSSKYVAVASAVSLASAATTERAWIVDARSAISSSRPAQPTLTMNAKAAIPR
jgi:hypothetical protein